MLTECPKCSKVLSTYDAKYPSKYYQGLICQQCSERENMVQTKQLKITAEVDGKQVPLENISTETFEAIKALKKPKEIPVARWAVCSTIPRLLFRPTCDIILRVGTIYALDLKHGVMACSWAPREDEKIVASQYKRVTPQL